MISDSFGLYWVFEGCFNQPYCISNNFSQTAATSGLLEQVVFWKKGLDVIISVQDLTTKILSHVPNYFVDVAM